MHLAREKPSSELVPCETHHVGTRAALGLTSERVQSEEPGPSSCAELVAALGDAGAGS